MLAVGPFIQSRLNEQRACTSEKNIMPQCPEAALALFSLPMGRGRGAKSCGGTKKLSKKREKDYSPPLKLRILRCKIKKIFCEAHFQVIFGQNRTKTTDLASRRAEKWAFFCSKTLKTDKKIAQMGGAKL